MDVSVVGAKGVEVCGILQATMMRVDAPPV
jgi:hypothetical protein